MATLEQLLDGPISNIYSNSIPLATTHQSTSSSTTSTTPFVAYAAPPPQAGQRKAAPSQKELVELYNSIAGRWVAEPYDQMDQSIQNETYSPPVSWALSTTTQSMTSTRRVETQTTIQLNRDKQQEAPIGWEVNTTFATNTGHFIGNIDQDGVSVRCFAGIGPVGYQGSQTISFSGEEDSTVHNFSWSPASSLALGYKYQSSPQATVQIFSAATKVDTVGLGLETTFMQGNIVLNGKVAKKWYLFPTPDVRRGDDATAEMQQAQRTMSKSQILTSATLSNMGDVGVGIASKVGWKAIRDFALSTRVSLAQGRVDVRGAMSIFVLGRRLKFFFDNSGSLSLLARFGVWGDSNLDVEAKLEFNPIQAWAAGEMPVLGAKLNWNLPVAMDAI